MRFKFIRNLFYKGKHDALHPIALAGIDFCAVMPGDDYCYWQCVNNRPLTECDINNPCTVQ